jgi:hypothetical protein
MMTPISRSDLDKPPVFEPDEPRVWPFGGKDMRGRLLTSFPSEVLVILRREVVSKNRRGDLDYLLANIDSVLSERGGE